MGVTFSVVCLTPQMHLIECIMGSYSIFCCLRNYPFALFVCYLIVIFVKNHVPRGVIIIPIILQCPMESSKGGGVLSAILFTLYLDKFLIRLKNSNIRSSINGCYTGALSYADDITLSCPSIRGLNRMLEICNTFAAEHILIFNTKKSVGIKYGDPVCASETIYLGETKLDGSPVYVI